jgi:hypothetical protein
MSAGLPFLKDCLSQEHRRCRQYAQTVNRLASLVAYTDTEPSIHPEDTRVHDGANWHGP